jgi:uncharacterized membrane protein YkvA (DUF1232 family)
MAQRFATWRSWAAAITRDIGALAYAARDPRVPWYARAFIVCVAAYALSPIDLIPDFIPVLGYVDDLILLPLGMVLALELVPADVLAECRAKAGADGKTNHRCTPMDTDEHGGD